MNDNYLYMEKYYLCQGRIQFMEKYHSSPGMRIFFEITKWIAGFK
jgi:hypothetical protein